MNVRAHTKQICIFAIPLAMAIPLVFAFAHDETLYKETQIGLPDAQKTHAHTEILYPQADFSIRMSPSEAVLPNVPITFHFAFDRLDSQVTEFDILHAKKLHLIIVSSDMKEFYHVHPEFEMDGSFILNNFTFPREQTYALYFDVSPAGSGGLLFTKLLSVGGGAIVHAKLQPITYPVVVDAMAVTVSTDPKQPSNVGVTNLSIAFSDAETGAPITDIEPYLAAAAHFVILDEKTFTYLHVHPVGNFDVSEKKLSAMRFGPVIQFQTSFLKDGMHKGWLQFMRGGVIHTVPVTFSVAVGTGLTRDVIEASVQHELESQKTQNGLRFFLLTRCFMF